MARFRDHLPHGLALIKLWVVQVSWATSSRLKIFIRTPGIAAVGSSRAHQERSGMTPRQHASYGKNTMNLLGYGRGVVCYIA